MLRASFPIFEICLWPLKDTCLIFSTTAENAAIVNNSICDASLKETMNTTVENDATANDISDESKDKKREILPRYYILLTHSLFFRLAVTTMYTTVKAAKKCGPRHVSYFLFWNDRP